MRSPLMEVVRKSGVRMPRKVAIVMMLVYIAMGSACVAVGILLVEQALSLHSAGRVFQMAIISGIVVVAFGVLRIGLSIYHLVRIRKQFAAKR